MINKLIKHEVLKLFRHVDVEDIDVLKGLIQDNKITKKQMKTILNEWINTMIDNDEHIFKSYNFYGESLFRTFNELKK